MKILKNKKTIALIVLVFLVVSISVYFFLLNINFLTSFHTASTLDAFYERAVYRDWKINGYAWGENTGWLTFSPNVNATAYIADDGLAGYLWGENIGWVSLSCRNTDSCGSVDYGVLNDYEGNLSGFAWGENVGWIDFGSSTSAYQVTISATGTFSGYAWGENIGWINFGISSNSATSTWTPRSLRAQCDDGMDNDSDGKVDYPTDSDCASFTDDIERGTGRRSEEFTGVDSTDNDINISTSTIATTTSSVIATTTATTTPVSTSTPSTKPKIDKGPSVPPQMINPSVGDYVFKRNLSFGDTGSDVRKLQVYLNSKGFTLSTTGAGSPGKETEFYGIKTTSAIKAYQEYYREDILTPFNLKEGTGNLFDETRKHVNNNY